MTEYANWTQDYPERVMTLYSHFKAEARKKKLDMTFLITIASSVIIIPRERSSHGLSNRPELKITPGMNAEHLENELATSIKRCTLLCDQQRSRLAEIPFGEYSGDLDQWYPKRERPYGDQKQLGTLIKHLRNALAHGNLITRGRNIEEIVFLSRPWHESDRWNYLRLNRDQLEDILNIWMDVLKKVHTDPNGPATLGAILADSDDDLRDAA
jgi:hypothetical protein